MFDKTASSDFMWNPNQWRLDIWLDDRAFSATSNSVGYIFFQILGVNLHFLGQVTIKKCFSIDVFRNKRKKKWKVINRFGI